MMALVILIGGGSISLQIISFKQYFSRRFVI
jgi:actin-like ATPase involved in cell morphogenesis